MDHKNIKINLNPVLALTFMAVGVTGLLLFFHLGSRGIKNLHEWMSIVFLAVSILHLVLNWKPFLAFLKHRPVVVSIVLVTLLSGLLLLTAPKDGGRGRHGNPNFVDTELLEYSPRK